MKDKRLCGFGSLLAGLASVFSLHTMLFWGWVALAPLSLAEGRGAWYMAFLWLAIFLASAAAAIALLIRLTQPYRIGWPGRCIVGLVVALVFVASGLLVRQYRWELRMIHVPSAHRMAVDTTGYTIEKLPFRFHASFARGLTIYFADGVGGVYKADDRDPTGTISKVGESHINPRMLFVSSRGTIFVSGYNQPLLRSADGGGTWAKCLDWSFWRMDEDEATGTLYAGNYSPRNHPTFMATVFRSTDDGQTWQTAFRDERLDHVHTVRYDPKHGRIYIAIGDTRVRGQAYSQDGAATWQQIIAGRRQGHSDVAFSRAHVFWGSDDWMGRVIRASRATVEPGETILWCKGHQGWFVVASGRQVYVGTLIEDPQSRDDAFLLASSDEGRSWQKLLVHNKPTPGVRAFLGESRGLSAGGWVYFATDIGEGYRVRKTPAAATQPTGQRP